MQNAVVLVVRQFGRRVDTAAAIQHFRFAVRTRELHRNGCTRFQVLQIPDSNPLFTG
ncbi:hypothetical protein D3C85_1631150 [compost metagenome]